MMRRATRITAAAYSTCTGPLPTCIANTRTHHSTSRAIAVTRVRFTCLPQRSCVTISCNALCLTFPVHVVLYYEGRGEALLSQQLDRGPRYCDRCHAPAWGRQTPW